MPTYRPTIITREEWGAQPARSTISQELPLKYVRYLYTSTEQCRTREACTRLVRGMQQKYLDMGYNDLPANFLIGGDSAVYEGRGWEVHAKRPKRYKRLKCKCIDIAYIGTFPDEFPPLHMIEMAAYFVRAGIDWKKLVRMPHVLTLNDYRDENTAMGEFI